MQEHETICESIVIALYKFVTLEDFESLRGPLLSFCKRHRVKGTLLLAKEGINGTIAGKRQDIDAVMDYLRRDERFADIDYKESLHSENPFYRMKVKLKKEIVTLGVERVDPNCVVGTYVEPEQWNELISDPSVLLVDTRNDYEYAIGTFAGAVNPETTNFREFPQYVEQHLDKRQHSKVAMFCTGGIRCEKATAYMLAQGFDEVYHLKGGILRYLEHVPEQDSLWRGECFVFDNRVAVNHRLQKGSYDMCHACRHPISEQDKAAPEYEPGVSCSYCYSNKSEQDRARYAQRQRQIEIAARRQGRHVGISQQDIVAAKAHKAAARAEAAKRSQVTPN